MIFAYTYNHEIRPDKPFLAIMPDVSLDRGATPCPIDKLAISDCAVFYVSNEEAVCVSNEKDALIIKPLAGQKLYITTNLTERPGVLVKELKVKRGEGGSFACDYKKEKDVNWIPWTPNKIKV